MKLPLSLDDLTADVMTELLSRRYPGTEVQSLRIVNVLSGTCTKVKLQLDYNDAGHAHGLPPSMCMKGGFESHGLAGQVYPREVWFYKHLAERIGGALPKCYFADRDDRQAIILMEDLLARSARFASASDAASVEQMQSLLAVLAAVHGHFWERPELDVLADEPARDRGSAVLDFSDQVLYQADNFQRMMRLPRAGAVPPELRNLATARHCLERLIQTFDAGPRCLIHGDAHLGNTFQSPGVDTGFIDWQTYARGHWAFDVSHLLCTGMTSADRRQHEQHLLEFYLEQLNRFGGHSPGMAPAWQSYRRMAFYGFAWAICPPELQPEAVCSVCAERVVTAITDLGTLQALDEHDALA